MPKKKSGVRTTKTESEVVQAVDACLAKRGFRRSGSMKKFIWRKGYIWSIFVSVKMNDGTANFEIWNYAPIPGLGSYIMYFRNRGQFDDIMLEVQQAAAGTATTENKDDKVLQPEVVPELTKKTVSGFAKGWIIFWIVGNIGAALAALSVASHNSSLGDMVMLLSICVVVGYFMLLYKNHIGLYIVIFANLLPILMYGSNSSISVTTGLIPGIITYFITRKQIRYPFGKSPLKS